ncbi:lipase [Microbacterium nanhaiense]|uniref:Lipase n=1 Tax=Microbacterium nanhaiense TaxID=1301026 RepID=A0ABQ2N4V2_9MICO|nr:SGNH/GDSL hydrolase family protein [Microbacterium nanhaiense]GGO67122.1 lipase [Microbacterium nanhaiense]
MTETFVFAGDSITDAGRREDHEGWGDGYVRLIAVEVSPGDRVVNAGISGDRVRDLRRRWDADVLAAEPTTLTVYVGINDTWRRFDSDDPTSADEFRDDYRALLAAATEAGVGRLVLIEPFVLTVVDGQEAWADDLAAKQAVVRELADEFAAAHVPLQAPFEQAGGVDPATLAPDGVHPSSRGHALIHAAWRRALRF